MNSPTGLGMLNHWTLDLWRLTLFICDRLPRSHWHIIWKINGGYPHQISTSPQWSKLRDWKVMLWISICLLERWTSAAVPKLFSLVTVATKDPHLKCSLIVLSVVLFLIILTICCQTGCWPVKRPVKGRKPPPPGGGGGWDSVNNDDRRQTLPASACRPDMPALSLSSWCCNKGTLSK